MIKLFKFELKRVDVVIGIYAAAATFINIICMIISACGKPNLLYDTTEELFPTIILFLSGVTLIIYYAIRCYKDKNLYVLTNSSETKVFVARIIIVFALMSAIALMLTAESTLVSVAANRAQGIKPDGLTPAIFNLYGAPFASWLRIFGTALFFTWLFALSVAPAALTRFNSSNIYKIFAIMLVIAIGCFVQFYIGALVMKGCEAVDFNTRIDVDTMFSAGTALVPENTLYYLPFTSFNPTNLSYFYFNVLSLAEISFVVLQIICCVLVYSLKRISLSKKADMKTKKQFFKLLLPACLILFYILFAPLATSDAKAKKYGLVEEANAFRVEVDYAENKQFDITQYIQIDNVKKLSPKYEITYNVEGWSFDRTVIAREKYKLGNEMDVSPDYHTLTMREKGYYSVYVVARNKFTNDTYFYPLLILFGQEV